MLVCMSVYVCMYVLALILFTYQPDHPPNAVTDVIALCAAFFLKTQGSNAKERGGQPLQRHVSFALSALPVINRTSGCD